MALRRLVLQVAVLAVMAAVAYSVEGIQSIVHPACPGDVTSDVFERIEDITLLLHGGVIPSSLCLFNPTVTRLREDLLLWAVRAYAPRFTRYGCVADPTFVLPAITNDAWRGSNSLVLAVTRTIWTPRGKLSHSLVGLQQVDVPMEDGRLFKDGEGAVWLLMHIPKAGYMSVSPVEVTCESRRHHGELKCNLELGGTRVLWVSEYQKVEKNWVPHNGTSRMSYPHYPAFGPHSVLDFGSYHDPGPLRKKTFDSVASNSTLFSDINQLYMEKISFAGSTPAVLHDDGLSYVAVGHVRANPFCFHDVANISSTYGVQLTCEVFASRPMLEQPGPKFFRYQHDGHTYSHHYKEYAFFFYRFSAAPPFEITHMSHGYLPCTHHHSGVVFPAGVERIGPNGDFLVAYGEANRYARLLTISAANMDRLLVPAEQMRDEAPSYHICSVPCES